MALTEITVTARGEILERASFASAEEAERYKAAVRRWGFENGILVGVWCRNSQVSPLTDARHWLLPAQAV